MKKGNGECGMGNEEWGMGNGEWKIKNGKLNIFLHLLVIMWNNSFQQQLSIPTFYF